MWFGRFLLAAVLTLALGSTVQAATKQFDLFAANGQEGGARAPFNGALCADPNRHFETCGTACPPLCQDLFENERKPCTLNCVRGCFCNRGLFLDDFGECVPAKQCRPRQCPPGKVWMSCGPTCPKKCPNIETPGQISKPAEICQNVCAKGCFCPNGLWLDNNFGAQRCVQPSQCPGMIEHGRK